MGESTNGRRSLKKVFCFATSPVTGHWLTCFTRKGYSHRILLFSQILLPEIRREGIRFQVIASYLLRIEKKSVIFSGSKQIPLKNTRKTCKSLPKHLILPSILPGCFEFVLQDYTSEHVNIPRKKANF